MPWSIDARVPVRFGALEALEEGDALLMEDDVAPPGPPAETFRVEPGHVAGCACCVARNSAGLALDRLFQRRARGEVAFFRRVLVVAKSEAGDMEVWSALRTDVLAMARFREG